MCLIITDDNEDSILRNKIRGTISYEFLQIISEQIVDYSIRKVLIKFNLVITFITLLQNGYVCNNIIRILIVKYIRIYI